MGYIYETHLHTIEASACSVTFGEDYPAYMKELGYSGMIVTDHFFTGNSCVPKNLPWEKRVEQYCLGYEHAKAVADKDFIVLFGIEFNFQGDEFLLYGVDKAWLLDNPDLESFSRQQLYESVHHAGGIMIQAHPYRERGYLSAIHLTPGVSDGVEVYNAANPDEQNARAYEYTIDRGMLMAGGSDIHSMKQVNMGGMSFPYPIYTIDEYIKAFMAGDGTPVCRKDVHDSNTFFCPITDDSQLLHTTSLPKLEVVWH